MIANMHFHYAIAQEIQKIREDMGPIDWKSVDQNELLKRALLSEEIKMRGLAGDSAVDAAPYMHSKLAQIQHQVEQKEPQKLEVSWKEPERE